MSTSVTSVTSLIWNKFTNYQNKPGEYPRLAYNNDNIVVTVYLDNGQPYYQVGKVSNDSVTWGTAVSFGDAIDLTGDVENFTPNVAINNNYTVVLVYCANNGGKMYAMVGTVNTDELSLSLGSPNNYDKGLTPTIAINDNNVVVEIHKTQSDVSSQCYYHVGSADPTEKTINLNSSHKFIDANRPSVGIDNNNNVVSINETSSVTDSLWCSVGLADTTSNQISWGESTEYGAGYNPSLSFNNNLIVAEIHDQSDVTSNSFNTTGSVDTNSQTIAWNMAVQINQNPSGRYPSIGINDQNQAIMVYNLDNGEMELGFGSFMTD